MPRKPLLAIVLLAFAALSGCETPIGVRRVGADKAQAQIYSNAILTGELSQHTTQTLANFELTETYEQDPEAAIAKLHAIVCQEPSRRVLLAIAELSYLAGADTNSKAHYLAAALYAQEYVFFEDSVVGASPFDPHFRLACEIYNRSLAEFLKTENGEIGLESGRFKLPFGQIRVASSRPGFHWSPAEFTKFLPASEFEVRGFRTRYRRPGLGVALVAPRSITNPEVLPPDHVAPRVKVAATAFLRVNATWGDFKEGELRGSLELYDTYDESEIAVRGRVIPLETDLTTPLAYTLEESPVWSLEIGGFLSSEKKAAPVGLAMVRPHVPGRIPVVLVHGTASSAARWAQLFNALLSDSTIRERYEFWLFQYSTGNPIAYSALLLREALQKEVARLDPEGADAALRQMVLVGHSQGGIIARLQVITAGDKFVNAICTKSIDELDLTPEVRDLLRRGLMFKEVPFVRRVVFMSTPHRGTFLANRWYTRFAGSLVTLPKNMLDAGQQIFGKNDASMFKIATRGVPTSIANMDGASPFLQTMNAIPFGANVIVNSIIAVKGDGPPEKGNDGIVEYRSAHVDGAESEYIAHCGHSCQENLLAIQEVRRILLQHVRMIDAATGTPGAASPSPAAR